ncbi:hypothetical protein DIZ76_011107 [Coccidioides immitis]|uniref:WW-domain-binding protein n=2 Tax=Coccidioides immitis TaxID=5501 RepID=A0A0J8QWS2_COCIT|nr:hypothetical protein CIRG_01672 [Coccidioides immitis RMSCC 2394]KMU76490.1 hypothetical protein CISG_01223 [Coccidioides immitis RMSCC 3703]TPX25651.1 hypothetical protein DIZ76_011107 [Coccidioides immitis]
MGRPTCPQKPPKRSILSRLHPNSWVMLHETDGFVRLPNERLIYTSPLRTTISLQALNPRPGDESLSLQSSNGRVHLTNQRIVYLPVQPTPQFQSFSAPLLNLHDTFVSAPFFGPNVWSAIVQPVVGGGIPPSNTAVQVKMTFKEGGAFDFHSAFERIKERLQQVVEQARENGMISERSSQRDGAYSGVNFTNVHLDELPAYEGPSPTSSSFPPPFSGCSNPGNDLHSSQNTRHTPHEERFDPPTEPPPGYEEAQQQGVANDLEARLRRAQ